MIDISLLSSLIDLCTFREDLLTSFRLYFFITDLIMPPKKTEPKK